MGRVCPLGESVYSEWSDSGVEQPGKSWAIPEDVVKPTKQKSGPKPKQTTNGNP